MKIAATSRANAASSTRRKWPLILLTLAGLLFAAQLLTSGVGMPASIGLGSPPVRPTTGPAATGGLHVDYFANRELSGAPVLSRTEGPIDLRWEQGGGPAGELRAPLSARWQGVLLPPATGSYTLITTADDGVRLRLGGQTLIDRWSVRPATEDRATLQLEAGRPYPIVIEYFDRGYVGVMRFEWEGPGIARQLVPAGSLGPPAGEPPPPPPPPTPVANPGLQAHYFANVELSGAPVLSRTEGTIDLRWEQGGGPAGELRAPLSARWQGVLLPPATGSYTLITTADDGVRLRLGDQTLIDRWSVRPATEDRATLQLEAGRPYPIVIEYFDRGVAAVMRFEWEGPGIARQLVPAGALSSEPGIDGGGGQAIVPVARPAGAPEQVNPLRGYYRWNGTETVPSPSFLEERSLDSYRRYEWRDLEPSRDNYNFSLIDEDIAAAAARGGRHGLRVRALLGNQARSVPDYLIGLMEKGWWADYNTDGDGRIYVPDWNDPDFLDRAERLLEALGERYNDDPRVSFIDVGFFGIWGEWHTYRLSYPSSSGAINMTRANRERLVDMHLAAFPDKYVVMMSDDERALIYALRQSPRVGWRRDSLGDPHFTSVFRAVARLGGEELRLFSERWKTAPVITEYYNPSRHVAPDFYNLARQQVERYHVSMVGNGNSIGWGRLNEEGRAALASVGVSAGYRYAPASVTLSAGARAGGAIAVTSRWSNSGSAPTHEQWEVVWQLRRSDGGVAWEGVSGLDLRTVLPASQTDGTDDLAADEGEAAPAPTTALAAAASPAPAVVVSHTDRFTLPAGLATGTYRLTLLVRDAQGYSRPMRLAIEGLRDDGAYNLGQVIVSS